MLRIMGIIAIAAVIFSPQEKYAYAQSNSPQQMSEEDKIISSSLRYRQLQLDSLNNCAELVQALEKKMSNQIVILTNEKESLKKELEIMKNGNNNERSKDEKS